MSEHYDFHYQPTGSGAISGQQVLEQTEDAINELGDYVYDNVGGAMDVAQEALETAQNAQNDAQTALDTANSFSSAIQSAQQDASTALSTAQTAQTTATNANATAIQASQDASSAVTTANNASGQVSTLSGTVTALGQRVTTAEGNIGQNTSDITALTTRVGTAEGNITTLQNDVSIAQGNASSAMATAGTVKQQSYVLRYSSTTLTASSTNSNSLLDNTDNLKVGDKVLDSSGNIYVVTAIDTANSTFTIGTALIDLLSSTDVGAAALSNNYNDLDNLPTIPTVNDATLTIQKNGVDVQTFSANASSNVTANITVPTKTSDLTNDSNFVDTSNSAVSSGITSAKVTDYDTHIADTDIHVTTADKNKWNNNTYVLRYSSTTLVASSTNSNSLLDNTDNLKVGDKVIDASGVIYSVTVIDTANSTFTIGTSLIDLAQDSDVVHKSGNETIGGQKTFDNNTLIYNSDTNATTPSLYLKSSKIEISPQGNTSGDQNLTWLDKNSTAYAYVKGAIQPNGSAVRIRVFAKDSSDNSVINELQILAHTNGRKAIFPSYSNEIDLGLSSYKWKSFNGLEPSSLSLPSGNLNNIIDISSYLTYLDGTDNTYVAPSNGWITINMNNCSGIHATITGFWGDSRVRASAGAIKFLMPVLKNQTVTLTIHGGTIDNARFIPCQGNV